MVLWGERLVDSMDSFMPTHYASVYSGPGASAARLIYLVEFPLVLARILVQVGGVFVDGH